MIDFLIVIGIGVATVSMVILFVSAMAWIDERQRIEFNEAGNTRTLCSHCHNFTVTVGPYCGTCFERKDK
jgi:hypothetical protein